MTKIEITNYCHLNMLEVGHVSQILLGSTLVFLLYEFYCLYFNFLGNETGLLGSISESS